MSDLQQNIKKRGRAYEQNIKDEYLENLALLVIEIEKVGGQDEMASARNRQELSEPLDDTEDQRLDQQKCVQRRGSWSRRGRRVYRASIAV